MAFLRIFLILLVIFSTNPGICKNNIKVVSLAPSITSSLYLLDAQDGLVGVTNYCVAKDKEIIGTMLEPNIEKIYSLGPDYVITTKEGNNPRLIDKLQSLKINTVVLGPDYKFGDIVNDFLRLAKIVEKENKAEEILSGVKSKIDSIREKLKGRKNIRVFLQLGENPLITIGKNSFLNEIITAAGGENIFQDINLGYLRVNKEEVMKRDPEIILIVPMEEGRAQESSSWPRLSSMRAVKENKVFVLEKDSFLKPTPVAFAQGLELFSVIIHPEAFKE